MHEEDDNKKSLNDTRLSPKNTQITSINSKEYHIFNSSSNGTKYQSSDNLTQESTCDADDLPSKSSIELKNSSNQSQKTHDDSQNHFPKRGRVDTPAHGNNSYHSFENSSRKKSSFIDVEKIKKNDKCQPMDCYVTPPRPDSHIKNLQINLEGTCNGADMEKFEPNQEASISSLRPFTPKTLDYSTIHECLSTTSYDSSNASIELPFKERYAPYDDHKWANLGKDILRLKEIQ
ncbi:unnamed protein product [Lepeophtheirus salmonis]|uniref:(salmon louse) hypothetical protein n=1 Tax=Lepeophtheirus salmonis TaxID=72036 RepID=A0A7R8CVF3_LEPSM|nr:unnamed protein product [Lepeophtheirus salmonis]CAF2944392.1 unnamed protein product [Lepeophtheirus salmonis]